MEGREKLDRIVLPAPRAALELARGIGLPDGVRERLSEAATPELFESHAADCAALTDPQSAPLAWKTLRDALSETDSDGMQMLALYLAAACRTQTRYRALGIPDGIFRDTMACFSRFLQETRRMTGKLAFDRDGWAWRQLSCLLFRLGTLEFEYRTVAAEEPVPPGLAPGDPILSVHIPSDACLSRDALRASYGAAGRFFAGPGAAVCKEGAPRAVLCRTWLLAPALRGLLPAESGILRFAADYAVYTENPEDETVYRWLFHGKKPPEPLPLETSLQRAGAAYLMRGGKIGAAGGLYLGAFAPQCL